MEGEPILEIGVGNFDVKPIPFLPDERGRFEPGFKTVLVDLFLRFEKDLKPRIGGVVHEPLLVYFSTAISTTVENDFPIYGIEMLGHDSIRKNGIQALFAKFFGSVSGFKQ